jgi:predicted metallopeptidase
MGRKALVKEVKEKNKKLFVEEPSLEELAKKVIKENKLDYVDKFKVKYILVDKYISKTCVAKCVRASKELKFFAGIDYIIEVSKDVWDKIDEETKSIVMYHELLHILGVINKDGDLVAKIADHNVKDFSGIIKKYGVEWFSEFKTAVSSIRDMDMSKSDGIKV